MNFDMEMSFFAFLVRWSDVRASLTVVAVAIKPCAMHATKTCNYVKSHNNNSNSNNNNLIPHTRKVGGSIICLLVSAQAIVPSSSLDSRGWLFGGCVFIRITIWHGTVFLYRKIAHLLLSFLYFWL